MAQARLSMRKIKEILRLKFEIGLSDRGIAQSCNISPTTVDRCLMRFQASGLSWPLPEEISETELEERLYPRYPSRRTEPPEPDWAQIHQELRKKHVTLALLWQEYKQNNPEGYQYSWFCERYTDFKSRLDPVMRQHYEFGEKCFVDYAGDTVPIINFQTGEIRQAQLFVGALGASNYTYADLSWSQNCYSWLSSHKRMFEFYGGVPKILVPDNLKSGVTKADFYEPDINPAFSDFAAYYEVGVIPARVREPRDKAKVENAVLQAERWIIAALRNRKFFSLEEANEAVRLLLKELNEKPFQKMDGSRESLFHNQERPALRPLPASPYEIYEWKKARVGIDYHVEVDGHYYSVPHRYVKEQVEVHLRPQVVSFFHKGIRIASHKRSFSKGFTTLHEHMPLKHQKMTEWNAERIISWAGKIGPSTALMAQKIMERRFVPEQGFRSCLGLLRLSKFYPTERLEQGCLRALEFGAFSYKSVKSILEKGLDRLCQRKSSGITSSSPEHENIRGSCYYQ